MSWHQCDRGHSHKSRQSPALRCSTTELWPSFGAVAHPLPATTDRANMLKKMAEEVAFLCSALGTFVVTGWYEFKRSLQSPGLMYNASNAHADTSPMGHIAHLGIKGQHCQGY